MTPEIEVVDEELDEGNFDPKEDDSEIIEDIDINLLIGESNGTDSALADYLRQIGPIPRLTAEEEIELAKRIEQGDVVAQEEMMVRNLKLVIPYAKKYFGQSMSLLDLIEEGNIGLMRAVQKFDWRRGFKFSTYAVWWIRQAIGRGIQQQDSFIYLPNQVYGAAINIRKALAQYMQENGEEPSTKELRTIVAKVISVEPDADSVDILLNVIQLNMSSPTSLDIPVRADENKTLNDVVGEEREDTTESEIESQIIMELLERRLNALMNRILGIRELRVLQMRNGMAGFDEMTLDEIGREFGVTRERIRQIEVKALRKLQADPRVRQIALDQ